MYMLLTQKKEKQMANLIKKINLIKKNHTGMKADLINKIARIVTHSTGMNLQMATAFAASQVTDNKTLMVR